MRKRLMNTVNVNLESGKKDIVWILWGEYPLAEWLPLVEGMDRPAAGMLLQDLDIPRECLNQINRTLADFAEQALMHARPGTPAVIRLFCQETALKGGIPAGASRPKQTVASPGIIRQAAPKMTGGWGFFLVERSEDFAAERPASAANLIDLYVYREGK